MAQIQLEPLLVLPILTFTQNMMYAVSVSEVALQASDYPQQNSLKNGCSFFYSSSEDGEERKKSSVLRIKEKPEIRLNQVREPIKPVPCVLMLKNPKIKMKYQIYNGLNLKRADYSTLL